MSESAVFGPKKTKAKRRPFEVYDIETTIDLKRAYLVGWYDGFNYKYWESEPLPPEDPKSAVAQFCEWLFTRKQFRFPIYAHNGGNFDHLFVLRWLLKNRPDARAEFVPIQSTILVMDVWIGKLKFRFLDSYRLMSASLDSLAKTFLGHGKVEGINYETLHLDPKRYEYLRCDCVSLYDCLHRFESVVADRLKGALGVTVGATAIATLQESYLTRTIKPLTRTAEELVRKAYYGGRTEVFHKGGTFAHEYPLRCYDINSMYPWALTQQMPTDGCLETTVNNIEPFLHSAFPGFVTCTVDTSNCDKQAKMYPVLPYRVPGKLLFPLGRFSGTWTLAELSFAQKHGYEITHVEKGVYMRPDIVFKTFIDELYKLRDKSLPGYDATLSIVAKLLANTTYGKFGTSRERKVLHLRPPLADILEKGMTPLATAHNLPVYIEEVELDRGYILPHLAAWVTALARIRLLTYIYNCAPHRVFYCDTDSIFTTALLESSTKLGDMKLEYGDIVEARFIAPKVYELTHADGHKTTRAKGFSQFGKGFAGTFDGLSKFEPQTCSAFSKLRTVLHGDFGLVERQKRMHEDSVDKREFLADGSSRPLVIGG